MKEQIGFHLQPPLIFGLQVFKLSLVESTFCRSGRDRAPGKWMKSLASSLCGSKIVREAKKIHLANPAEPGYPFGDPFELL